MITKVKSTALWNQLSAAHRQTLEDWLFEQRLSYQKAWQRATRELGFTGSISSIRRFYQRAARERQLAAFTHAAKHVKQIRAAKVNTSDLCAASLKAAGMLLLQQITQSPDQFKHWLPLARLLQRHEESEHRRQALVEANALRQRRVNLACEQWQFDAIEQGQKVLPELQAIARAKRTPLESAEAHRAFKQKIKDIRMALFGRAPEAHFISTPEERTQKRAERLRKAAKKAESAASLKTEPESSQPQPPAETPCTIETQKPT